MNSIGSAQAKPLWWPRKSSRVSTTDRMIFIIGSENATLLDGGSVSIPRLTASRMEIRGRYAALAVFLGLLAAFASAFRFAAHLWRILSAAASRWAAVNFRRLRFAGLATLVGAAAVSGFFGGLPRRFVGPWRASIARVSLSRSAISKARICSVGIQRILA